MQVMESVVLALQNISLQNQSTGLFPPSADDVFEAERRRDSRYSPEKDTISFRANRREDGRSAFGDEEQERSSILHSSFVPGMEWSPLQTGVEAGQTNELSCNDTADSCFHSSYQGAMNSSFPGDLSSVDWSCQDSNFVIQTGTASDVDSAPVLETVEPEVAVVLHSSPAKSIFRLCKSESDLVVATRRRVSFADPLVTDEFPIPRRHSDATKPCHKWKDGFQGGKKKRKQYSLSQEQPLLCADFNSKLRHDKVRLAMVESSATGAAVSMQLHVANIAFEKSVFLRITQNSWATWKDIQAQYVHSVSAGVDVFEAKVQIGGSLLPHTHIEFAVGYNCQGEQYWDSNYGRNYEIC